MKKYLLFCLIILCILCGCAALKAGSVSNNIFSSPGAPKIQIKVDDAFSYLGDMNYRRESEAYVGDTVILKGGTHLYIFVMAEGNKIRRAISIQISHTEGHFLNYFVDTKGSLEYGECELGGEDYRYLTDVYSLTLSYLVTRYTWEKRYIMPDVGLTKDFVRVLARDDTLLKVTYIEDFSDYCNAFKEHKRGEPLTADQQNALSKFNENCMKSFEVLQ